MLARIEVEGVVRAITAAFPASDSLRNCFEQEPVNVGFRGPLREVEHLEADDAILLVVIHDDAGRDFLGTSCRRLAQGQI